MNFKDFNFKLSIISALHELGYYEAEVKAIKAANNDWEEDHTPIPAVLEYYQNLEIDPAYLAEIESYLPDGGDLAYAYLTNAWDGEDDQFDIHSIEGIEHLVNLVTFDAISMIADEGVDFTPLLACEKLEYANAALMRKDENTAELIRKFLAKEVNMDLPEDFDEAALLSLKPPKTPDRIIHEYQQLLDEATTFASYNQVCQAFIQEPEMEKQIVFTEKEGGKAALETLQQYSYPADFLEWHTQYGHTQIWVQLYTILSSADIAEQLNGYAQVMSANNLLLIGSNASGDSFVYDVNIPDQPRIMLLSHEQYYPADMLEEFYSECMNFYWDDSTETLHNPDGLDPNKIWDENRYFNLSSPYIREHLESEMEAVEDADSFLPFIVTLTKAGIADF